MPVVDQVADDALLLEARQALRRNDPEVAKVLLERVLQQSPESLRALNELGQVYLALKRYGDALRCYTNAVEIDPSHVVSLVNLGAALNRVGQFEQAIALGMRVLDISPDHVPALKVLGFALFHTGDLAGAEDVFQQILSQSLVDDPEAHVSLAQCFLLAGNLAEGAEHYEWRLDAPDGSAGVGSVESHLKPRRIAQPMWDGLPALDKTVLLHGEQGAGDMVQFVRFVRAVHAMVSQVVLEVPAEMVQLCRESFPGLVVIARGDEVPPFDAHVPMMSLMHVLRLIEHDLPASPIPYLRVSPEVVDAWGRVLARSVTVEGAQKVVGLVWRGESEAELKRAMPLRMLEPLLAEAPDCVRFVVLQRETELLRQQIMAVPEDLRGRLEMLGADFESSADRHLDTLAAMHHCDLVVSTDAAAAHLAGALGKPVWVMVQKVPSWVWGREKDVCPWYPSARVFRQEIMGDWSTVVQDVTDELVRVVTAVAAGADARVDTDASAGAGMDPVDDVVTETVSAEKTVVSCPTPRSAVETSLAGVLAALARERQDEAYRVRELALQRAIFHRDDAEAVGEDGSAAVGGDTVAQNDALAVGDVTVVSAVSSDTSVVSRSSAGGRSADVPVGEVLGMPYSREDVSDLYSEALMSELEEMQGVADFAASVYEPKVSVSLPDTLSSGENVEEADAHLDPVSAPDSSVVDTGTGGDAREKTVRALMDSELFGNLTRMARSEDERAEIMSTLSSLLEIVAPGTGASLLASGRDTVASTTGDFESEGGEVAGRTSIVDALGEHDVDALEAYGDGRCVDGDREFDDAAGTTEAEMTTEAVERMVVASEGVDVADAVVVDAQSVDDLPGSGDGEMISLADMDAFSLDDYADVFGSGCVDESAWMKAFSGSVGGAANQDDAVGGEEQGGEEALVTDSESDPVWSATSAEVDRLPDAVWLETRAEVAMIDAERDALVREARISVEAGEGNDASSVPSLSLDAESNEAEMSALAQEAMSEHIARLSMRIEELHALEKAANALPEICGVKAMSLSEAVARQGENFVVPPAAVNMNEAGDGDSSRDVPDALCVDDVSGDAVAWDVSLAALQGEPQPLVSTGTESGVQSDIQNNQLAGMDVPSREMLDGLLCDALLSLRAGHLDKAEARLRGVLALVPDHVVANHNLGVVLLQRGQFEIAETRIRQALEVLPNSAEMLFDLARVLRAQGQLDEAIDVCQQVLIVDENSAGAHRMLAEMMNAQGRQNEAIRYFESALALMPDDAALYHTTARTLLQLGRADEAQDYFAVAAELVREGDPCQSEYLRDFSQSLLCVGDWDSGWAVAERAYEAEAMPSAPAMLGEIELWNGGVDSTATLYVHTDDAVEVTETAFRQILTALRSVAWARERVGRIVLVVPSSLKKLASRVAGVDQVLAQDDAFPDLSGDLVSHSYQVPLVLLPGVLALNPAKLAQGVGSIPTLRPDLLRLARWRAWKSQHSGVLVGLAWRGCDEQSSVPLAMLRVLAEHVGGVSFVVLQRGEALPEAQEMRAGGFPLLVPPPPFDEGGNLLMDTAALIDVCDLVITADTTVAHLACVLGKNAWVMASSAPDWCWGLKGERAVWYPSARMFRQERLRGEGRGGGDVMWAPVVAAVVDALAGFVETKVSGRLPAEAQQEAKPSVAVSPVSKAGDAGGLTGGEVVEAASVVEPVSADVPQVLSRPVSLAKPVSLVRKRRRARGVPVVQVDVGSRSQVESVVPSAVADTLSGDAPVKGREDDSALFGGDSDVLEALKALKALYESGSLDVLDRSAEIDAVIGGKAVGDSDVDTGKEDGRSSEHVSSAPAPASAVSKVVALEERRAAMFGDRLAEIEQQRVAEVAFSPALADEAFAENDVSEGVATEALLDRAVWACQIGQYDEAIEKSEMVLLRDPESLMARLCLGRALVQSDRPAEAEAILRVVLSNNVAQIDAWVLLAQSLQAQGRFEECEAALRDALEISPSNADVHNKLAQLLTAEGRLEDALSHYREVLRLQPANAAAYQNAGSLLLRLDRCDEAVGIYRRALAIRPNHPASLLGLGKAYQMLGRMDEAAAVLEEARDAAGRVVT